MLTPGEQVHHYIVEARVGGGGTASVYRVRHAILQHTLALKVLAPELVDRPDLRRRFLAEGRIQARVRHPAIVMVTDAVVDAPRKLAGLVMEYIEGPNLGELIGRMTAPPPPELFRSLIVPVLEALHHGHEEGVIHRDVKPSNILLSRDAAGSWHPRLADFGIAHILADARLPGTPRITEPEGHLGTPAFMAPEQIDGGSPSVAWDVFAMGCVMYELATGGVHPFERPTGSETMAAIQRGVVVSPSAVHDGIDRAIEATILAALAPSPDKRAPSCADLLLRLQGTSAPKRRAPRAPAKPVALSGPLPETRMVTSGAAHERQSWALTKPRVRVGRNDADIALGSGADVEGLHAEIEWMGDGWQLRNRAAGGTRVNGARVDTIRLEDGDLLRMGHQVLKFHTEAVPSPRQAASIPPGPRLVLPAGAVAGDSEARIVPIGSTPVVLGRAANCDVILSEPTASGRHCRVYQQGLDVVVEDLGSHSGTWVDDQRVRFRSLREGSQLRIGALRISYRQR